MKKKLIIQFVVFLTGIHICFGQEKIAKYCEVRMISKWGGDNDQKISINLGNPTMYFKDSTEKKRLVSVNNLKNAVDVLDYMSKLAWSLVSISAYGVVQVFYFKKEFDKSEFTIDSN